MTCFVVVCFDIFDAKNISSTVSIHRIKKKQTFSIPSTSPLPLPKEKTGIAVLFTLLAFHFLLTSQDFIESLLQQQDDNTTRTENLTNKQIEERKHSETERVKYRLTHGMTKISDRQERERTEQTAAQERETNLQSRQKNLQKACIYIENKYADTDTIHVK